jgi:cytosine/uracil/thiamine/allantoin permease
MNNKIDWFETISTSLFILVIGGFMVWATVLMGWWALCWPVVFAFSNAANRIESYRLGHIRKGEET